MDLRSQSFIFRQINKLTTECNRHSTHTRNMLASFVRGFRVGKSLIFHIKSKSVKKVKHCHPQSEKHNPDNVIRV